MIGLAIDAFILIALLKVVTDDDTDFWTAVMVAIGTSLGTYGLVVAMSALLGSVGYIVGLVLAPVLLAALLVVVFSIDIKRAALIAVLYTVLHMAIGIGVRWLIGR